MPLIHNDNTNDRDKRSYETEILIPAYEEPKMFPVEHSRSSVPKRNKRPNELRAGLNALKGVGRQFGLFKKARPETVKYREDKCHNCDLNIHDIGTDGKYVNEWCGHKYLSVTIGKVSRKDAKGCGCKLYWKRLAPNERCPKEQPDWVEERPK